MVHAMLMKWIRETGESATIRTLIEALEKKTWCREKIHCRFVVKVDVGLSYQSSAGGLLSQVIKSPFCIAKVHLHNAHKQNTKVFTISTLKKGLFFKINM